MNPTPPKINTLGLDMDTVFRGGGYGAGTTFLGWFENGVDQDLLVFKAQAKEGSALTDSGGRRDEQATA